MDTRDCDRTAWRNSSVVITPSVEAERSKSSWDISPRERAIDAANIANKAIRRMIDAG
jgi:hypothetical protein